MTDTVPIPAKRYFTIGEVSELCGVKPHVLRYWEQEFTQLRPVKRRGNRRYYQHHEVLMIRRIRDLLYEQGFTINGARNQLQDTLRGRTPQDATESDATLDHTTPTPAPSAPAPVLGAIPNLPAHDMRGELIAIRDLLTWPPIHTAASLVDPA